MENRSKHYGDVAKWIEKVINSCETKEHTNVARNLVSNFEKQLKKEYTEKYYLTGVFSMMILTLESMCSNKRFEIIEKQLNL